MSNNDGIEKLAKEIEFTRTLMHKLMCKKQYNLLDSEIIKLSQILDRLLVKYYNLKR